MAMLTDDPEEFAKVAARRLVKEIFGEWNDNFHRSWRAARMPNGWWGVSATRPGQEVWLAIGVSAEDAELIAAAPEMLKALKASDPEAAFKIERKIYAAAAIAAHPTSDPVGFPDEQVKS